MNRNLLWLIGSLFVVLLLVLTNPKVEEHKAAVKTKFDTIVQAQMTQNAKSTTSDGLASLGQNLGTLLGGYMLDKIIETGVSRSNYLLFSTTDFMYEGETKTIGLGILGNVYLSSEIDKAVKETTDKLKE